MALDTGVILAQLDDVLARCGGSKERPFPRSRPLPRNYMGSPLVDGNGVEMSTSCIAAIERIAPLSAHARTAQEIAARSKLDHYNTVRSLMGVLVALRKDVEAGYLQTLQELVHADLFADFLEMADELQRSGYKDAAAVIAGSTLEEHLRKLAAKNQLSTQKPDGSPKKADALNAELAGVPAYNKLVQKSVTAWLDLRNSAAHGKYGEYDHGQVAALIRDVRNFAGRYPA
jgi:hypothetical protein